MTDFFNPLVTQLYPDPEAYDLIVLSGRTADPMGSDPWVLKLQDLFVPRSTVPRSRRLSGYPRDIRPYALYSEELSGARMKLTKEGCKMFPLNAVLHHHQFHRREIKVPSQGFVPLAEEHKAFLNDTNTI
jgi:hypothetical protein